MIILKFDKENENNVVEYCYIENDCYFLKNIKGGSQGVLYNGEYIFIGHGTINKNGRTYYHVLLKLNCDDGFFNISFNDIFFIEKKGIEYISGLTRFKNKFLCSYGTDDNKPNFIELDNLIKF